ncbi:MAG TPA: hypothetical protein DER01_06140 [Phycisphaerales bacterium]|nr:hypothetical protein [Phycisphaerales bacterium]|tara:strand:- start:1364 stop:3001 length:1638 start_codon:yes stop_codon:yes gene_type:complete
MKRFGKIWVTLGLIFLIMSAEERVTLFWVTVAALGVFVILQTPAFGRLATRWVGKTWSQIQAVIIFLAMAGVMSTLCILVMYSKFDQYYYNPTERLVGFLAMILVLSAVSILCFVMSFLPWKKFLQGEGLSDLLVAAHRFGWIMLSALFILIFLVSVLLGDIDGLLSFLLGWIPPILFLQLVFNPTVKRIKDRRVIRVLMHIKRAMHANQSLVHVLQSAAASEHGQLSVSLKKCANRIAAGEEIVTALIASVPELSCRKAQLLRASEKVGQLPRAIDRFLNEQVLAEGRQSTHAMPSMRYMCVMLLIAAVMFTGLMTLIVPRFMRIFEDFDTTMPPITMSLFDVSHWLGGTVPGQFLPGAFWITMIALGGFGFVYMRERGELLGRFHELICWHLPVIKLSHRPEQIALMSHLVADGLEASMSLDQAIAYAVDSTKHVVVQPQFKRWASRMQTGEDISTSARRSRLPKVFCSMLGAEGQQQNLPQVMRFLAEHYHNVAQQRAVWIQAVEAVCTILIITLPVAWICMALISPLAKLIQHCSITSGVY